jgi:tetratricopeptide (TPR) repeat protein
VDEHEETRVGPPPRVELGEAARWLVTVAEHELAQHPDPARAARLHFEVARVLPDPLKALDHYLKAIDSNAQHLPSIRAARRLWLELGDVKAAVALFDREIELVADARDKARLWFAKGRALEDAGGDLEAARACYRRAVQLDATSPTYFGALGQSEHAVQAWEELDGARAGGANAVVDSRHRAALLVGRARLHETRLGRIESATDLYKQAWELDANSSAARQALKRLFYVQERWRDLIAVLEREAAQTRDPAVRTHALFAIGRVQSERLGDRAEAVRALARAMQSAPSDRLVLECLARLYEAAGEQKSLAHTLAHAVEPTTEPAERVALLCRIGAIYERRLHDDEQARRWYESALGVDAGHAAAINALDGIYVRARAWEALIVMHLAAAEAIADSTRRAAAHARIAAVFEDHVAQPEEAMRHHARALSLDPTLEGSFKALARLYAEHGRHRQLIELYERGIERASERDVRCALLLKIGLLHEDALRDPAQAMHAYERVLIEQPDHLAALHALQRSAERAGRHADLCDALEREAGLTDDPRRKTALLQRAGDVLADKICDREAAVLMLRRVLELDPSHAQALASLAKLYQATGRYEALRDIYERELGILPKGPRQLVLLQQLGELCEKELGDDDQAQGYYRRAIAQDPSFGPALRALSYQLLRKQDYKGLVGVLQSELIGEQPPEAFAPRAYRLGEVYEMHLEDYKRAAVAYEQALEAMPDYRPAIEALGRVRVLLGDFARQAKELVVDARRLQDSALAIDALLRAGEIYADILGAPGEAIAAYGMVRSIQRDNLPALLALEPLLREAGRYEELLEVYATLAGVLGEPRARVAALEELARLHETHVPRDNDGDLRRAYHAILSIDGSHIGALEGLERVALKAGDAALLCDVDARFARALSDPALVAAHQCRLGDALVAGNPAAALAAYKAALEHEPHSYAAIRGLGAAARACGDTPTLIDALRREAAFCSDGALAAEALVQSAKLRLVELGDPKGAIDDAERALERWPDHEHAARTLGDLLREARQIDRLITLLSRAAGGAKESARVGSLWRVVARLYADDKADIGAALAALDRLSGEQANDPVTLKLRGDLYVRNKQWNEAIGAYERALAGANARDLRLAIHLELSRLHTKRTGNLPLALEHLRAVVKLDGNHREALLAMFEIYGTLADHDGARVTAQKLLKVAATPAEQAWAWLQLGRVELRAGRVRQAADALHNAVAIEGPHGDAAADYKKLLGDDEPWSRYVEALSEHLKRVRSGELQNSRLRDVYAAVARIQHEVLLQVDDAVRTLRAGLEATGDPELHMELAERLAQVGRADEAVIEYRSLIHVDPTNPRTWRGLARTFHETGRKLESGLALAPVALLGDATEIELGMSRQRRVHAGYAQPDSFNPEALMRISAGDRWQEPRIAALLASIGEALAKVYPPDFERYGVAQRDRLRPEHATRQLCDRLARCFGVIEFDVYLHKGPVADVVAELSQPAAIMVPQFVADLPEEQQVFMLARAFATLSRDLHAAVTLGRRELTRVVIAALRTLAPAFGVGLFGEEDLNALNKKLVKALSRRNRKALEVAGAQYFGEPPIDLDTWSRTIELSSARAAAILCNDLGAVLSVFRQTGVVPARAEGAALVHNSPILGDLLRFWPSPEAFELRRAAGIL